MSIVINLSCPAPAKDGTTETRCNERRKDITGLLQNPARGYLFCSDMPEKLLSVVHDIIRCLYLLRYGENENRHCKTPPWVLSTTDRHQGSSVATYLIGDGFRLFFRLFISFGDNVK